MPKYSLKYRTHIDAAHFLPNYNGKCKNLHGHRWKVEVTVQGDHLNEQGMLVDFSRIKEIINRWDHQLLNNFVKNPTAENLATALLEALQIENIPVCSVEIWESPNASVKVCHI
jgi:6-pyruvoyltetrahydropterin/6-carboxytetrahydropterin synthase